MEVERTLSAESPPDTEPVDVPSSAVGLARPMGLADWRGDVALELWVEVDVDSCGSGWPEGST